MYDLSILIPARSEQFVSNTVKDILKNKRGKTEIIVGLDGEWAEPEIEDHQDVKIVYVSESIGQRGMTNKLCKLSQAKYVAKCDAHCAFSEGFDVELMKTFNELGDDITVAPLMKNLHAFDWKCMKCGKRTYQGPKPVSCEDCDNTTDFTQRIVFKPRKDTPNSYSYRFNTDMQFWYFGEYKEFQEGELVESMSLQGSFFMCTRENYWKKKLCDESWGSWGAQGTEVACKTWLSGGRVIIDKRCWYAHLFRTQTGFSFPYPQSGSGQQRARKISQDMFLKNNYEQQIYPLSWLIEKFWEGLKRTPKDSKHWHGWTQEKLDELKKVPFKNQPEKRAEFLGDMYQYGNSVYEASKKTRGILYFTDNELPLKYARPVQKIIRDIAKETNYTLVSSTRKPMSNMGKNVVTNEPKGYLTMFKQILKGLEAMEADIVFMAEHDVLYPKEHFAFLPLNPNKFYYDTNWYKVHVDDGLVVRWTADQVSGLCAYRDLLIQHYKERIASYDEENFDRKFEPGSGVQSEQWSAEKPHVDLRTGRNLTYNKRSINDFRDKTTAVDFQVLKVEDIPGWPDLDAILK